MKMVQMTCTLFFSEKVHFDDDGGDNDNNQTHQPQG